MADVSGDLVNGFHGLEKKLDRRFDAVDAALVEQRQYTEFAFEKLERRMNAGFDEIKAEFAAVRADTAGIKAEVGRLERKFDQFIDRHFPAKPPDALEQPQ